MTTETTTGPTEIKTMNIEEAKDLAKVFREHDIPTYFHSAPGIGKSDIMRQLADEDPKGSGFIDVRVGTMLPEDLTGIPVPDLERRVATWLRAEYWPNLERDGPRGIIAFDELSDANKNLQSCIYRVVLERQIGEYKLPRGWWPTAAGNRREDRAAAQTISTALANRFAHIHIRPDADIWRIWANTHDINPLLIGFIKFRPDLIHSMEGATSLAFPTPRSWAMASPMFNQSPAMRYKALCAIVGEGAATEVETYFKIVDLPAIEDILNSPSKAMIPEEPASRYALSSLLARKLTPENFAQIYKYIKRDDFGADLATVVILDGTKRDPLLCETATFTKWARDNTAMRLG
jgi:hypothetical protein